MGMPIQNPSDPQQSNDQSNDGVQGTSPAQMTPDPLVQDQMLSQTPGTIQPTVGVQQPAVETQSEAVPESTNPVESVTEPIAESSMQPVDVPQVNEQQQPTLNTSETSEAPTLDSVLEGYNIPGVSQEAVHTEPAVVAEPVTTPVPPPAPVMEAPNLQPEPTAELPPVIQPQESAVQQVNPIQEPVANPEVQQVQTAAPQTQTLSQIINSRGAKVSDPVAQAPVAQETPIADPTMQQAAGVESQRMTNAIPDMAAQPVPVVPPVNELSTMVQPQSSTPQTNMDATEVTMTQPNMAVNTGSNLPDLPAVGAGASPVVADTSPTEPTMDNQPVISKGPTLDEVLPEVTAPTSDLPPIEDKKKMKKDKSQSGGSSFTMIALILVFIIVGIFLLILGLQLSPNIDFNIPFLADLLSSLGVTQ